MSAQWLRFGTGGRKAAQSSLQGETESQSGVIIVGQQQEALVPVVQLLTRRSSSNIRVAEKILRAILSEQEGS